MTQEHQLYTLEEAIQWMRDNQDTYTDPSNKLVCIGAHISIFNKQCFVVKLDYRKLNTKLLQNPWQYTAEVFSNHYLLPLNKTSWHFKPQENTSPVQAEFTYTPDFAKWIRYAFIEIDRIEGEIGKKMMCKIYPELNDFDNNNEFLDFISESLEVKIYKQ